MMTNEKIQVNINPTEISSLVAFLNINGLFHNGKKDVYFVRYIGFSDEKKYIDQIREIDRCMNERKCSGKGGYFRGNRLDSRIEPSVAVNYATMYQEMQPLSSPKTDGMKFRFEDPVMENTMWAAYEEILGLYRKSSPNTNESIIKNFAVKLLYWIDTYLALLFDPKQGTNQFPKFMFSGDIKVQEYLFLYLLVCLGCDVLYLNPEKDASMGKELLDLSHVYMEKNSGTAQIPEYCQELEKEPAVLAVKQAIAATTAKEEAMAGTEAVIKGTGMSQIDRSRLVRPPSKNTKPAQREIIPPAVVRPPVVVRPPGARPEESQRRVLEYEELARLSPSIVMINVYNKKKECFKTGSGVVISEKGYILTNFHVACEGEYYGIRFEEEEQIHETDGLVKYNQFYDLAVIKIDRRCTPIHIYRGEKDLVRGQKVVAIGSPLGLFNSVSDGIISGFRVFDDVSMIQFTAPISHGSSGGALLNLYGELIGIITAGFDDGQNINLAVDYKSATAFARGFI